MSLSIPIPAVAGSTVTRLHKLPPFTELMVFLTSSQFPDTLPQFINEHLGESDSKAILSSINSYYEKERHRLIHLLPANSPARHCLALQRDYEVVKQTFLDNKEPHVPISTKAFEQALASLGEPGRILYPQEFRHQILRRKLGMIRAEEVFSLIAYLEESYLVILSEKLVRASDFYRSLVTSQINTYTFMSAIKRFEKGQSKEHILDHTLPIPGIPAIIALKSLQFGDLVGEIGADLDIPAADISVTRIETELLNREVIAFNHATYLGMGDERIIQYMGRLYHFLSDIKLAYFQAVFHGNKEETQSRMVNYNLQ